jgi:hypothetical protein
MLVQPKLTVATKNSLDKQLPIKVVFASIGWSCIVDSGVR